MDANERRESEFEGAKARKIESFVDDLIEQWPSASISPPTNCNTYIKVQEAIGEAGLAFYTWY